MENSKTKDNRTFEQVREDVLEIASFGYDQNLAQKWVQEQLQKARERFADQQSNICVESKTLCKGEKNE